MTTPFGIEAMVGRDDILEHLLDACRRAVDGRGSMIVLTGEAGVGKSRLCQEVAARALGLGFGVAETRCWSHGGAPPLWPWREVLRQLELDTPPASDVERVTLTGWTDLTAGFSVFEGAADRLRWACERRPRLVIIEDLHEADEGTLLLSRFLAPELRGSAIVVLATTRAGSVRGGTREAFLIDEIEQTSSVVDLPGLERAAMAELVAATGRPADEHGLDLLLAISRGNPLVAQSVLRAAPPGPLDDTVAVGVHEAFQRRLAPVDPSQLAILARAAVLGLRVDIDELAEVCGRPIDEVRAAADVGLSLQVLGSVSPRLVVFAHDLVREAVESTLDPIELQEVHGRAADVIAAKDRSGDGALRAVRHALVVAERTPADRDDAVRLARAAAGRLLARDAFSDAAALLADTIDVVQRTGSPVPAVLRIELAHAMLAAGRVGEAHDLSVEAAQAAEAEGEPLLFAEAAAGLGGIWINNVRSPVEQSRILTMQRAALAGLPEGHDAVGVRLRSRIATGAVFWEGARTTPLFEVVEAARQLDDPAVSLEVSSNVHTALLGPDYGEARLELADEMIKLAGDVRGGVYALLARCWRAVDLYLLGSDHADQALADLRGPAEALQCQTVVYVVRLMETMLLIRAGRLDEADQAALAALDLGRRCQDADAVAYYGAQLLAVRWLQGRDAELLTLLEDIAASENVIQGDHAFNAAVAAVAARAGRLDVAGRYLSRVLDGPGLVGLPKFSTWLATMTAVVEAAAALGDVETAAVAYDLLLPYAGLPVVPSLAVVCFGSVQLPLGQAARTAGRIDAAIEHLETAVLANVRLGNTPRAALARVELALALQEREGEGDSSRAAAAWDEAIDLGTQLGLSDLVDTWRARRQEAPPATPVVAPVRPVAAGDGARSPSAVSLRRDGRSWVVEHEGEKLVLPDRVGLRYLAQLVEHPGQPIPAKQLATGEHDATFGDRQPVLDRAARDALEQRARELATAIADARDDGDDARQAELEDELDAIADELRKATGLGHRDRFFEDDKERARTAVRKAVVRATNEIEAGLPRAAEHLRTSITTGVECRYDPNGPPTIVDHRLDGPDR